MKCLAFTVAAAFFASHAVATGGGGAGWGRMVPACLNECAKNAGAIAGDIDSFCQDKDDNLTKANECIASSACSEDEKNSAYSAISQLCVNAGESITSSGIPEASYKHTTNGPPKPTWTGTAPPKGPEMGPGANGPGPHGGPWGGPNGVGPFGPNGYGPMSECSTNSECRNGPWTSWWGGSGCPSSDWSGWTSGSLQDAPWTSWSGCMCQTTTTEIVTKTVSGEVTTSTSMGFEVAQATGTETDTAGEGGGDGGEATPTVETQSRGLANSLPVRTMAPVAFGAAVFGVMVAL
ncbi:hypothetical protein GQ43DRAFT_225387 [Delitschia confertaspora ATCC 74209]|uniref:Extracellular membrane protein CFEM domain-containing protein n=1 Tax=Delitschia confertaspora ATCC 74209 TaxID=1513339 RepID=A0A9P4MUR8_9PLEO|nr:hypothetical protein GQ43DRAFT_225387 [Delitschia confertaspora ATCC 74209]